jgi:hypothetical protein
MDVRASCQAAVARSAGGPGVAALAPLANILLASATILGALARLAELHRSRHGRGEGRASSPRAGYNWPRWRIPPMPRTNDDLEPLPDAVEALIAQALAITGGDKVAAVDLVLRKMVEDDAVAPARTALLLSLDRNPGRRPRRRRRSGPSGPGSYDAGA